MGRRASARVRRRKRGWVGWFVLGWIGALTSTYLAWRTGEIRHLGLEDDSFVMAVGVILVVIAVSFSGWALFKLRKLSYGPEWIEPGWKPSTLAALSVVFSFGSALWSGYQIAIRIARDLTV